MLIFGCEGDTDQEMYQKEFVYCRYVDDVYIYGNSEFKMEEKAYQFIKRIKKFFSINHF